MAQLKDLIVTGASRLIGDVIANQIQITTLKAPTEAGGSSYGVGTSGQALFTNGTSAYWGNVSTANYYHTTGSWGGTNSLTYTATANGGAGALAFTLPTASTSAYGVTKLSSATNSDVENLAATPKAVKAAYDLAASKTANTGTVTSITLTAGAGITLNASTAITTSGTRTISITGMDTTSGSTSQVLSKKGTWVDLPTASSLGLSNYKPLQSAVTTATDNNTTNTRFVSGVTQDANGVITVVTELCPVVEVVRLA